VTEAVCILNSEQDHWAVAAGSFLLAKQAGFDLAFCFEDQDLPEAALYLLPCVAGVAGVPKPLWQTLLGRVRAGATLWVSSDDGYFVGFTEVTGLTVNNRRRRSQPARIQLPSELSGEFELPSRFRLEFLEGDCEVLAREDDGNPVWSRKTYGEGTLHFFALPLEKVMGTQPGTAWQPEEHPLWKVYRELSAVVRREQRIVSQNQPLLGVTEHVLDGNRVIVVINYSGQERPLDLTLKAGWAVTACWYGNAAMLPPHDGTVLVVSPT
jgi:hypothetical protein